MNKYPFILFLFLFTATKGSILYAQTKETLYRREPILDTQIEKAKKVRPKSAKNQIIDFGEKTLSEEVAFGVGKFVLKAEGILILNALILEIDEVIQQLKKQYPTTPLQLKINIIGYADGIGNPTDNYQLSAQRADIVYNYLTERLVQIGNIDISIEVISKGEKELPDKEITDYKENDPRRRICKLSSQISLAQIIE
jgi:outer membrane protein OmpA-like peptidoglycan-associated protein